MDRQHNPARAARRQAEALEQLGTEQPRCIYCGNTDPLIVRRRRIENHHIVGRKSDPMDVPACLNCHAVASEALRDADVPMVCEKEATAFARAIFLALSVHFSLLAKACRRFAKKMEE